MPPKARRTTGRNQANSAIPPKVTEEILPPLLQTPPAARRITRSVTRAQEAAKQHIAAVKPGKTIRSSAKLKVTKEQQATSSTTQSGQRQAKHVIASRATVRPTELSVHNTEKQKTSHEKAKAAFGSPLRRGKRSQGQKRIEKPRIESRATQYQKPEPERPALEQTRHGLTGRIERPSRILGWTADLESSESASSSGSTRSLNTAEQREFYKESGYDVTDDSSMVFTEDCTTDISSRYGESRTTNGSKKRGNRTTAATARQAEIFAALLQDFKIETDATKDDNSGAMKELLQEDHPTDSSEILLDEKIDDRWEADLKRCKVSNEAIFQRTVMMSLFDRYGLHEHLDFACEAQWFSKRMPRETIGIPIARPKPDLAVCFRTRSLMPDGIMSNMSKFKDIRYYMCPEKGQIFARAFYFLSVEVKGKEGKIGNTEAELQNLNTAAQGLYNIYVIMREAKQEKIFFSKIRFFSIVATSATFEVRVHRAAKAVPPFQPNPALPVIGYEFVELLDLRNCYTRLEVCKVVYNILYNYGIAILHPLLKGAVKEVFRKRQREAATGSRFEEPPSTPAGPPNSLGKRLADGAFGESFGSNSSRQRRRLNNFTLGSEAGEDDEDEEEEEEEYEDEVEVM